MQSLSDFVEKLLFFGLEYYRKFYGIYRGNVTRNDDPDYRGRIQVVVPAAGHNRAPDLWVEPAFEGAGRNRGFFWPPEVGDSVRVAFERGDPSKPVVYWGGWFGNPDGQTEAPGELGHTIPEDSSDRRTVPTSRGLVTRAGHVLSFEDADGAETVRLRWHQPDPADEARTDFTATADRSKGSYAELVIDKTGSVQLTAKNGSYLLMDTEGKKIAVYDKDHQYSIVVDKDGAKVTAAKIVLDGSLVELGSNADTPAVRGQDFYNWALTHKHPTAWGPSGPPLPLPSASMLSKIVKLH